MTTRSVISRWMQPRYASGLAVAVAWIGFSVGTASAIEIDLGPADAFATDQPRVTFALTDESANPATLIGPTLPGLALLDTAANGVLLGQQSYADGEDYGFLGQYNELGVAGTSLLDVHEPWGLRIEDTRGQSSQRLVGENVIAFGDRSLSLGSFNAVVGMPAMEGYVIEIDMRPSLSLEFQSVFFHDTIGQASFESAASKNVPLRIIEPVHTDTALPVESRPTFSGLPAVDQITLQHTGGGNSGAATLGTSGVSLVVDTGAQNTILNQAVANALGIDFTQSIEDGGDVIEFLEVGGIGGTTIMPIVQIDKLSLPTDDDMQLVWRDNIVGILDIEGASFDGVIGMNMLTTGYFNKVFLGTGDPLFDKVVFDFTATDGTALMRLDFTNPPVEVPEPSSLLLLGGAGWLLLGRRRR